MTPKKEMETVCEGVYSPRCPQKEFVNCTTLKCRILEKKNNYGM